MTPSKRWLPLGVLAGILILALSVLLRPSPPVNTTYDRARLVSVTQVTEAELAPQITGFGRVQPKVVWQALAEVGGQVVYRNPELEPGRLLKAGTLLLSIDPLEYELRLAQAKADDNSAQAQLNRLDQSEANLQASLALEQDRLRLAEAETQRKASLHERGLISQSELDNQRQSLLSQRQLVQELQNQITLLPGDRAVAEAQLKVAQAAVADAERRLRQTQVVLPMDARIAEVSVEQAQVATQNQVLVEAHGIDRMEVEAQVALHDMRALLGGVAPRSGTELPRVEALGLSGTLTLSSGDFQAQWPARVTGVREAVDPNQATAGVLMEVRQDYRSLSLTERPPLVKDLFVRATLQGPTQQVLTVPAAALRQNRLYLMDDEARLVIRPVEVLFRHGERVAVKGDIQPGQRVVLTDLIPAVEGMALRTESEQ
ncbi:HlyD family secretion protein [Ferrimonas balearica]|nr:HlyD family secretion protein [Ferrimonas balearica]